jgi:hypothetical protein
MAATIQHVNEEKLFVNMNEKASAAKQKPEE